MSAEEIKAMQRRLFAEFFSQGKLEVADEIFAPDHVYHNPDTPEGIHGPEGMKRFVVGTFRGAFPDLQGTVEDQIAEADKVLMRWTARVRRRKRQYRVRGTSRRPDRHADAGSRDRPA